MDVSGINNLVGSYQNTGAVNPVPKQIQEVKPADQTKMNVVEEKSPADEAKRVSEELDAAIEKLNRTAGAFGRTLKFQIHDKTKRTMVSVVDMENDKVIRQYPSEEVLDMVAKVDDYLGLIFDKRA